MTRPRPKTYDEFGRTRPLDVIAQCKACRRWINYGQSYRAIFRRAGGPPVGFEHEYCPPRLVTTSPAEETP